jgi:outer membrane translocation and assembly module TamA
MPVQILSVQFGAALFYDVGDTGRDFQNLRLRHGAGGGLRVAFPQIQRSVFRIDVGVPLDPHDPAADTNVIARFEQAFGVPALSSPGLL